MQGKSILEWHKPSNEMFGGGAKGRERDGPRWFEEEQVWVPKCEAHW